MEKFVQCFLLEEELANEENELLLAMIKNEEPDDIFKTRETEGAY